MKAVPLQPPAVDLTPMSQPGFSYTFRFPAHAQAAASNDQPILSPPFQAHGHVFRLRIDVNKDKQRKEIITSSLEWRSSISAFASTSACPRAKYEFSLMSLAGASHGQCGGECSFSSTNKVSAAVEVHRQGWADTRPSLQALQLVVTFSSLSPSLTDVTLASEVTLPLSKQPAKAPTALNAAAADGADGAGEAQPCKKRSRHQAFNAYDSPTYSDCQVVLRDGSSLHGHRCVAEMRRGGSGQPCPAVPVTARAC